MSHAGKGSGAGGCAGPQRALRLRYYSNSETICILGGVGGRTVLCATSLTAPAGRHKGRALRVDRVFASQAALLDFHAHKTTMCVAQRGSIHPGHHPMAGMGEKKAVDRAGVEGYLTTGLSKDMRRKQQWSCTIGRPMAQVADARFSMSACRGGLAMLVRSAFQAHQRTQDGRGGEGLKRGNVSIKPNAPVQHSSPSGAWACVAVGPVSPDASAGRHPTPSSSPSWQPNGRGHVSGPGSMSRAWSLGSAAFSERGIAVIC
ncbi:hypothetical protein QBC40DRAFT_286286, partial [Triangularia verruculosa]